MKFLNETATESGGRHIILMLHHPLGGDGPVDARSARARIGGQIVSANKTGKAEHRLNKRGVTDRNVTDYLHFVGRCGGGSEGIRRWGRRAALQSVPPFKDEPLGASGYLYHTLAPPPHLVPTSDLGNPNSVRFIKSIIFCVGPSHRGAVCSRPSQDPRIKTGLTAPAGPPRSHPSGRDK